MSSVTVILMLAFVAQAHSKMLTNGTADSIDELVGKMVSRLGRFGISPERFRDAIMGPPLPPTVRLRGPSLLRRYHITSIGKDAELNDDKTTSKSDDDYQADIAERLARIQNLEIESACARSRTLNLMKSNAGLRCSCKHCQNWERYVDQLLVDIKLAEEYTAKLREEAQAYVLDHGSQRKAQVGGVDPVNMFAKTSTEVISVPAAVLIGVVTGGGITSAMHRFR